MHKIWQKNHFGLFRGRNKRSTCISSNHVSQNVSVCFGHLVIQWSVSGWNSMSHVMSTSFIINYLFGGPMWPLPQKGIAKAETVLFGSWEISDAHIETTLAKNVSYAPLSQLRLNRGELSKAMTWPRWLQHPRIEGDPDNQAMCSPAFLLSYQLQKQIFFLTVVDWQCLHS